MKGALTLKNYIFDQEDSSVASFEITDYVTKTKHTYTLRPLLPAEAQELTKLSSMPESEVAEAMLDRDSDVSKVINSALIGQTPFREVNVYASTLLEIFTAVSEATTADLGGKGASAPVQERIEPIIHNADAQKTQPPELTKSS